MPYESRAAHEEAFELIRRLRMRNATGRSVGKANRAIGIKDHDGRIVAIEGFMVSLKHSMIMLRQQLPGYFSNYRVQRGPLSSATPRCVSRSRVQTAAKQYTLNPLTWRDNGDVMLRGFARFRARPFVYDSG